MFKELFKDLFTASDKKPLMLSFILQRDDCSRLLGEFGEKDLPHCSKLAIVWKNGDGNAYVKTSASLQADEAIAMLVKAGMRIGGNDGK